MIRLACAKIEVLVPAPIVINDYAKNEGLVVIWDLPQDFVVKSRFQISDTIAGTLTTLRGSIKHNFAEPVNVLLCPKKRSCSCHAATS